MNQQTAPGQTFTQTARSGPYERLRSLDQTPKKSCDFASYLTSLLSGVLVDPTPWLQGLGIPGSR